MLYYLLKRPLISRSANSEQQLSLTNYRRVKPEVKAATKTGPCLLLACLFILIVALSWTSYAIAENSQQELVVVYGNYDVAPYAIIDNDELVGGIIKDLGEALAKELELTPLFLNIPRKRMPDYIADGKAHVRIMFSPQWVVSPERFIWSEALFDDYDQVIIRSSSVEKLRSIEDLQGLRVGTILGHVYPILENDKSDLKVVRDDSLSLMTNLARLDKHRVDAVITSKWSYEFYLHMYGEDERFLVLDNISNKNMLYAMFSKSIPVPKQALVEACNRLKERGIMLSILEQYGASEALVGK